MKVAVLVFTYIALLAASSARAEQRWQCGDGISVPLTGTRAEREAECQEQKEKHANPPDAAISQEQADRLRQRLRQMERQYNVAVKVDRLEDDK